NGAVLVTETVPGPPPPTATVKVRRATYCALQLVDCCTFAKTSAGSVPAQPSSPVQPVKRAPAIAGAVRVTSVPTSIAQVPFGHPPLAVDATTAPLAPTTVPETEMPRM